MKKLKSEDLNAIAGGEKLYSYGNVGTAIDSSNANDIKVKETTILTTDKDGNLITPTSSIYDSTSPDREVYNYDPNTETLTFHTGEY